MAEMVIVCFFFFLTLRMMPPYIWQAGPTYGHAKYTGGLLATRNKRRPDFTRFPHSVLTRAAHIYGAFTIYIPGVWLCLKLQREKAYSRACKAGT